MANVNNGKVRAVSEAAPETLAMGNHKWTVAGDVVCQRTETEMVLALTTCTREQFTCADGLCVDMEQRCDGRTNCADKSDEVECKKVIVDSSYQQYIVPLAQDEDDGKLVVKVSVDIVSLLELDEVTSIF